jgi:hypothetical protein
MILQFIDDHWPAIVGAAFQTAVTLWMASIARGFQVSMSIYGTRIEAHREAVRRGYELLWLQHKNNDGWTATMNEMRQWQAMNEVFLEPAAAQAFRDIERYKAMQAMVSPQDYDIRPLSKQAQEGIEVLHRELLRFRKRTFREWLRDRRLAKKRQNPKKPVPTDA